MPRLTRATQFCLAALMLVLMTAVASAGPKQKIAVLGLEAVVGANGQIDPADTKFAKELTAELRARANNSKGYDLTKDQRELVDEKLMNNCASEQASCMGPIGASMGADVLLFGKVANAKGGGYKVSLTLVDVRKRSILGTDPNATVTSAETRNPGLGTWAREHYKKLTGEGGEGTLIITASGANSGRILVNGDTKDTLKSGSATLSLPEGRYRIGVEADGFKIWEQEGVTVSADKPTELKPDLVRSKIDTTISPGDGEDTTTGTEGLLSREGTVGPKKSKTVWKVAAGVGLGGAAVGTGLIIWSFTQMSKFENETVTNSTFTTKDGRMITNVTQDHCGGKFESAGGMSNAGVVQEAFEDACSARDRMKWLVPTTIGFAAIGAGALIYLMVAKDGTETQPAGSTAGRRAKKRKNLIVTPVVTPDNAGATLRFDW